MGLGAFKIRWWPWVQDVVGTVADLFRGDEAAARERERRAKETAKHYEKRKNDEDKGPQS